MRIRYIDWLRQTIGDSRYRDSVSRKTPPGGVLYSLDEADGPCWEQGYAEVEERLSAL